MRGLVAGGSWVGCGRVVGGSWAGRGWVVGGSRAGRRGRWVAGGSASPLFWWATRDAERKQRKQLSEHAQALTQRGQEKEVVQRPSL